MNDFPSRFPLSKSAFKVVIMNHWFDWVTWSLNSPESSCFDKFSAMGNSQEINATLVTQG
jgi:hypothetical protein